MSDDKRTMERTYTINYNASDLYVGSTHFVSISEKTNTIVSSDIVPH